MDFIYFQFHSINPPCCGKTYNKFFGVSTREKLIQDIVTSPQQVDKSGTNIITNKNTSSFNYWQSELIGSYIVIHFIEGNLGLGCHSTMWFRGTVWFYIISLQVYGTSNPCLVWLVSKLQPSATKD